MITQVIYLRKIWGFLLDILFPKICLNCRRYLIEEEDIICGVCLKSIEINKIVFRSNQNYLLLAAASYENEALRSLIHYFKYNHFLAIERQLTNILLGYLKTVKMPFKDAVIVPIPLHEKRFRERGFNQSQILANVAAKYYKLPLEDKIIRRIKNTKPQTELKNYEERKENLKNSFEFLDGGKQKIKNKSVLIVDDVYTSGATLNEAAKVLRRGGAKEIRALVLAKAG